MQALASSIFTKKVLVQCNTNRVYTDFKESGVALMVFRFEAAGWLQFEVLEILFSCH